MNPTSPARTVLDEVATWAGAWQQCVGTPRIEPGQRIWVGVV
jgi:hypothetical protein